MGLNKYIFYSNGNFKHFYFTDDGQIRYGVGTYTDKKKKRILRFGDPDTINEPDPRTHYEANFERNLEISRKGFVSKDYYGTTRKKKVLFVKKQ